MSKSDNSTEDDTVDNQPEIVDRTAADNLNNYAQNLGDKITHVVDYGGLNDSKDTK